MPTTFAPGKDTMDRKEKAAQDKARRAARKLAAKIGAVIDADRMDGYTNYYVTGTVAVYGIVENENGDPVEIRRDPFEGDHVAINWQEVLDRVEDYDVDMFFHSVGLNGTATDEILHLADPGARVLLNAWLTHRDDHIRGVALADWIEEKLGDVDLAGAIRDVLLPLLPKV